ncbi:MAG: cytochrome c [Hyphomicrobiaceae bacterium]|nr:cytochrome c [Hyphomicrobiaceae bacterium]
MKDKVVPLLIVAVLLGGITVMFAPADTQKSAQIKVNVPILSAAAQAGEAQFTRNCSQCHGQNAAGTNQGPPLIHKYYRPNHHPDRAFYRAAANGVRAHHWQFGNMPPVTNVKRKEVRKIISYVRELQRANGIY